MKLREDFITYTTGSEQIMVATGDAAASFRGMVRSNATAAFMVDCLRQELTFDQLVDKVADKYDAPRETIARDAQRVLASLRKVGALDE